MQAEPFWKTKTLAEMSLDEWESLCDGCGKCCLHKLEDEDDGEVYYTDVACQHLNVATARCSDYQNRLKNVPACLNLTHENLPERGWLPPSCAYRKIADGKPLAWWHPLVSGTDKTVIEAAVSVAGRAISELDVDDDDMEDHIIIIQEISEDE